MFRFPWSNFHELNLDWILEVVKEAKEIFINGEGDIQHAVETSEQALEVAEQAAAGVIADGSITIPKLNNEVLKTTGYVIVGNRADVAVPAGAYVYLRKSEVAGLLDGIYTAATNIPAGAIVTPAEFQQSTELGEAGALNVLKTQLSNTLNKLASEIAFVINGKYCALGAAQGQYVIVVDSTITGVQDGLYKAAQPIAAGEQNVTSAMLAGPIPSGGLNHLVASLISTGTPSAVSGNSTMSNGAWMKIGNIVGIQAIITTSTNLAISDAIIQNVPAVTQGNQYLLRAFDTTGNGVDLTVWSDGTIRTTGVLNSGHSIRLSAAYMV